MPNFGYQLYFKTDAAVVELEEVVDLFLQVSCQFSLRLPIT